MGNYEIKQLRKLLPLFESLLEFWKFNNQSIKHDGICHAFLYMYNQGLLTHRDSIEMDTYFQSKNPIRPQEQRYAKFKLHPSWKGIGYWWTPDEEGYDQRTKFIETIIEEIKQKLKIHRNGGTNGQSDQRKEIE